MFLCFRVFWLFWLRPLFIFQNNILGWQAATEYEMDEVSFLSDRMPASLSLSRIQRKHHFIEHNASIATDTTSRDTKPTPTHHSNITLGGFYQLHLSAPRPHNISIVTFTAVPNNVKLIHNNFFLFLYILNVKVMPSCCLLMFVDYLLVNLSR